MLTFKHADKLEFEVVAEKTRPKKATITSIQSHYTLYIILIVQWKVRKINKVTHKTVSNNTISRWNDVNTEATFWKISHPVEHLQCKLCFIFSLASKKLVCREIFAQCGLCCFRPKTLNAPIPAIVKPVGQQTSANNPIYHSLHIKTIWAN